MPVARAKDGEVDQASDLVQGGLACCPGESWMHPQADSRTSRSWAIDGFGLRPILVAQMTGEGWVVRLCLVFVVVVNIAGGWVIQRLVLRPQVLSEREHLQELVVL